MPEPLRIYELENARLVAKIPPEEEPQRYYLSPVWDVSECASGPRDVYTQYLKYMADRFNSWRSDERENELRQYSVSLSKSFEHAAHEYPCIRVDSSIMAGAPCIDGTRIPVYMILDAIEQYGTIVGVCNSYPQLSEQQVRDAIGFAKLVLECPVDNTNNELASIG